MSKAILIFLICLIVALIVLILALVVKNTSSLSKILPNTRQDQTISRNEDGSSTLNIPLDLNDKSVVAASLYYYPDGKLIDIKPIGDQYELITDIKLKGLPSLTTSASTQYFFFDGYKTNLASFADLAPNQKIRIMLAYGLKINRWTVTRVSIIKPLDFQSSPTPESLSY